MALSRCKWWRRLSEWSCAHSVSQSHNITLSKLPDARVVVETRWQRGFEISCVIRPQSNVTVSNYKILVVQQGCGDCPLQYHSVMIKADLWYFSFLSLWWCEDSFCIKNETVIYIMGRERRRQSRSWHDDGDFYLDFLLTLSDKKFVSWSLLDDRINLIIETQFPLRCIFFWGKFAHPNREMS